jgi:hypothetical protein
VSFMTNEESRRTSHSTVTLYKYVQVLVTLLLLFGFGFSVADGKVDRDVLFRGLVAFLSMGTLILIWRGRFFAPLWWLVNVLQFDLIVLSAIRGKDVFSGLSTSIGIDHGIQCLIGLLVLAFAAGSGSISHVDFEDGRPLKTKIKAREQRLNADSIFYQHCVDNSRRWTTWDQDSYSNSFIVGISGDFLLYCFGAGLKG